MTNSIIHPGFNFEDNKNNTAALNRVNEATLKKLQDVQTTTNNITIAVFALAKNLEGEIAKACPTASNRATFNALQAEHNKLLQFFNVTQSVLKKATIDIAVYQQMLGENRAWMAKAIPRWLRSAEFDQKANQTISACDKIRAAAGLVESALNQAKNYNINLANPVPELLNQLPNIR